MAQQLLHCSICPKLPSFSDTSHLLTHVSSKGHLSQWHKLQVRSYQDIGAGVALANYNQWCQQNDIDRLLSERMQMKEDKQAKKRRITTTRKVIAPEPVPVDQALLDTPLPVKRTAKPKKQTQKRANRVRKARREDNDSDSDFSPVKNSRGRPQRHQLNSSPSRPRSSDCAYPYLDDCPAENDTIISTRVLSTPEHVKLKGTIWPGMDLFDAATQEMQQKRNQKKDASVLRRMERLARLVEPIEVVFSPNGDSILKARHIDDLEDASSLIEGETPVPKAKQTRPRKRNPLAEKDINAPRLVKRKIKADNSTTYADLPFSHGLPPLPQLPSSSNGDFQGGSCRYFPVEQDNDFKPVFESVVPRKRAVPQFEIYTDGSPTQHLTHVTSTTRNPLHSRVQGRAPLQQLPKVSAAWLQPQYQSALQFTNPYTAYRPAVKGYLSFYEPTIANENISPTIKPSFTFQEPTSNPLLWKSPVRPSPVPGLTPAGSPFDGLFNIFSSGSLGEDPFVSTKNPLANVSEHFKDPLIDDSEFSNSPTRTNSSTQIEAQA